MQPHVHTRYSSSATSVRGVVCSLCAHFSLLALDLANMAWSSSCTVFPFVANNRRALSSRVLQEEEGCPSTWVCVRAVFVCSPPHPPHLSPRAIRADLSRSKPRDISSSGEEKADRSRWAPECLAIAPLLMSFCRREDQCTPQLVNQRMCFLLALLPPTPFSLNCKQ